MALSGDERASMSRLERWSIAARVVLALAVAVACALLATRILETRFLRARFDLSQDRSNTLDPLMVGVLARLEEEVVVDAYFTPSDPPFEVVGAEVQDRTRRLLRLMSDESGGLLRVELHDVARRGRPSARAEARRGELQLSAIEPGGLVVLSRGKRKELVRLRGGLADLDPGNPDPRLAPWAPARIVSFRAEESLAAALLALADDEEPVVALVAGQGGLDPRRTDDFGASLFVRELQDDGFRVVPVDLERGQALPEDTRVVALLSIAQPLSESAAKVVTDFVDAGGRLYASVGGSIEGAGGLGAVVARYGIGIDSDGIVARGVPSLGGSLEEGSPSCADLSIGLDGMAGMNQVTDPLRAAGRRVYLRASRALARGTPPAGASVIELLRAPDKSWIDRPDPAGRHDWRRGAGELPGRPIVAMQALMPALAPVPAARRRPDERPETRVLVVGAGEVAANWMLPQNRDFTLLCFNWLAARDTRVALKRQDPAARRLDLSRADALSGIYLVAVWLAPLACALLGLLVWWRRRA